MKNVNELRIPLYGVVNTETGQIHGIYKNRNDARSCLQYDKTQSGFGNELKIVKFSAEKFIR